LFERDLPFILDRCTFLVGFELSGVIDAGQRGESTQWQA